MPGLSAAPLVTPHVCSRNLIMTSDGTQHLLLAILARAIRDLRDTNPHIRLEAQQWLMEDPLCAEICEILGVSLASLHRATGLPSSLDCETV